MEDEIALLVASIYAGKDWHKLSEDEQKLVALLEKQGHLIPNNPTNGFVGRVPKSNQ